MAKIEPFEKYASEYDDWFEDNRFVYESELRAVQEQLPIQSLQRIKNIEPIKKGYGEGSFVVVKALKPMMFLS